MVWAHWKSGGCVVWVINSNQTDLWAFCANFDSDASFRAVDGKWVKFCQSLDCTLPIVQGMSGEIPLTYVVTRMFLFQNVAVLCVPSILVCVVLHANHWISEHLENDMPVQFVIAVGTWRIEELDFVQKELRNVVRFWLRKKGLLSILSNLRMLRTTRTTSCAFTIRLSVKTWLSARGLSRVACCLWNVTWTVIHTLCLICCRTVWFRRLEVRSVVYLICTIPSIAILVLRFRTSLELSFALPGCQPLGGPLLMIARLWTDPSIPIFVVYHLLAVGVVESHLWIVVCSMERSSVWLTCTFQIYKQNSWHSHPPTKFFELCFVVD